MANNEVPALGEDEEDEEDDSFIFDHTQKPTTYRRLAYFTLLAGIGYAGFFYLFKVVTPTATRPIPRVQTSTLLRLDEPEYQRLLRANEHKLPFSILRNDTALPEPPTPSALWKLPPSFLAHHASPELSKLPKLSAPVLLNSLPTLPPLAHYVSEPKSDIDVSAGSVLTLPADLEKRRLRKRWIFHTSLPQEEPTLLHQATIQVDADGTVLSALPDSAKITPGLLVALKRLRFAPVIEPNQPQWFRVEVTTFATPAVD